MQAAREQAEATALTSARAAGRPVVVAADTTEISQTVANPDGTFTRTDNVEPVRVLQHGRWRAVSATLAQNADGTWSPVATPSAVRLSGGGTGSLATLTSVLHGVVSVSFPVALPRPVVSGATATYRSVWPGVDLQVTVTILGGINELLVIHNRAAAANPALRHISFPVTVHGLSFGADHAGNLRATGPHDQAEFSGPPSVLTEGTRPAAAPGHMLPAGSQAHATATGVAADVATTVAHGALTLAPAGALLSPAAGYPAYVSTALTPDVTNTSCGTVDDSNDGCSNAFAEVQGGGTNTDGTSCTGNTNYNVEQGSGAYAGNGFGYQWWGQPCIGPYRSFYQFDTSGLDTGMQVVTSVLHATVTYGADLTCTDNWPVRAVWTQVINSSTAWPGPAADPRNSTQGLTTGPGPSASSGTPPSPDPNGGCTRHEIDFNIKYVMGDSGVLGGSTLTFGFYGDEDTSGKNPISDGDCATSASGSGGNCGFMRLGDSPYILTVFDLVPSVPTALHVTPAPHGHPGGGAYYACGDAASTYGWLDATDYSTASQVSFSALVTAGITDENVRAVWSATDDGTAIASPAGTSGESSVAPSPATVSSNVNFTLTDGHQYTWTAHAEVTGSPWVADGPYDSADAPTCGFNVDETPPTSPGVTSTQFPASGGGGTSQDAGSSGTFTFTSGDPTPSSCGSPCEVSGLYEFAYSLNSPLSSNYPAATCTAGATSGAVLVSSGSSATSCSVTVPSTDWGTNILYVEAIDRAGNISQSTAYYFYAPWNPSTTAAAGDVNGDGIPDLLATSGSNLLLYPGNTDPSSTPVVASPQAYSPDNGAAWSTYQIAHRGSMSQGTVDDLFVHDSGNLYLYLNGGTASQFASTGNIRPITRPTCTSSNCSSYTTATNWSDVTQIVAPGNAWNPTPSGSASPADNGQPSLLTVENGELWLYQGTFSDGLQDPVELGSSGWNNVQVVAPGLVGGTLTIWAYDPSTGNIYSYPITLVNGVPSLSASGGPVSAESAANPIRTGTWPGGTPVVASPGPLDNSSFPGLYLAIPSGTDPTGNSCGKDCLYYIPGQSTSGGASALTGSRVFIGDTSTTITHLS